MSATSISEELVEVKVQPAVLSLYRQAILLINLSTVLCESALHDDCGVVSHVY